MRAERISLWTVALLVAASAVTKLVRAESTESGVRDLLGAAGFGSLPGAALAAAIWALAAAELALAAVIALSSRPRTGLAGLLVFLAAGALLFGLATSWGRDAELACPCGLPLELPWLTNTFAAMLVRDAILVALIALAWKPGERSTSVALAGERSAPESAAGT